MSRYWKAVIAFLGAVGVTVLQAAITAYSDEVWTVADTLVTAMAFATALGVYSKANVQPENKPYDPTISEAEVP